ncbi:hypothetical protein RDI58_010795 [Solanum bulbocastanum]|uniref:Uncharacterized protein n=1 Tax=Solanum bulbocastanum TaxID=147425 RepID=A0AAN8TQ39_SOLBU
MGSISFLVIHSGRWNKDNCYIDYTIKAIMLKEYATFRDLLDEVAKQIGVDLIFNSVKLKYKIEGSNAPLKIHNEMSLRVYVLLKKDNKELAKYPLCVSVSMNFVNWLIEIYWKMELECVE